MIRRKRITSWDDVELIINAADLAYLLGYTQERVSRMAARGEIPAFRSEEGAPWRFRKDKLIAWMDEHSNQK